MKKLKLIHTIDFNEIMIGFPFAINPWWAFKAGLSLRKGFHFNEVTSGRSPTFEGVNSRPSVEDLEGKGCRDPLPLAVPRRRSSSEISLAKIFKFWRDFTLPCTFPWLSTPGGVGRPRLQSKISKEKGSTQRGP